MSKIVGAVAVAVVALAVVMGAGVASGGGSDAEAAFGGRYPTVTPTSTSPGPCITKPSGGVYCPR